MKEVIVHHARCLFFMLKLPKSRDWKILRADMEISALFVLTKVMKYNKISTQVNNAHVMYYCKSPNTPLLCYAQAMATTG